MLREVRRRFTYANVASSVALFIALAGGTAWAVDEWTGANIENGTLTSADYRNEDIRSVDIRDDSRPGGGLAGTDLGPGSVGGSEVSDGSMTSGDIADQSLTGSDVKNNTINADDVFGLKGNDDIQDETLTASDLASQSVRTEEIASLPAVRAIHLDFLPFADPVPFTLEDFDTAGMHSSTHPTRFVAPVSGMYLITADADAQWDVSSGSPGSGSLRLSLRKYTSSGTHIELLGDWYGDDPAPYALFAAADFATLVPLGAGNYVELGARIESGTNRFDEKIMVRSFTMNWASELP